MTKKQSTPKPTKETPTNETPITETPTKETQKPKTVKIQPMETKQSKPKTEKTNRAFFKEGPDNEYKSNTVRNIIDEQKINAIKEDLKDVEDKKKPRGINAKRIKEAKEKNDFISAYKGAGSFLLGVIVSRLPNPKPLTPQESEQFDTIFSKVLFKYSESFGQYQDEISLGIVSLSIILPRLKTSD